MHTPHRILRADAEDLERTPPELTQREQERDDRILTLGQGIMARRGSHALTMSGLAQALRIGAGTLRRHFVDLDALLAALLHRHLRDIVRALAEIPQDAPNRPQKLRAAYLAFTRSDLGGLTEAHLLLVRDRHLLPEDLLTPIERRRQAIGDRLAPGQAEAALGLLDMPCLDAPRIEAALAAIVAVPPDQARSAASPAPTPPARPQPARAPFPGRPKSPPPNLATQRSAKLLDNLARLSRDLHNATSLAPPQFRPPIAATPQIHSSA
jgi:AcrR family transcriptional regulator